MAVSFDEEDIIALGVDVDPAVAAQLQAALNDFKTSVDQTNAKLEQATETSAKLTENLSKIGSQATAGVDQAKNSVAGLSDQLSAAAEKAEELSKAMPYNTAYDVPRPPPAPGQYASPNAEPEVEPPEVPGGGVSSGGSAFSLARGLSVAGHATGSPVLREAGGLIYMEEGLRKSLPLFEKLNEAIVANAGPMSGMVEGVSAIGIPMAGLVTVAVAAAAAIALVAIGIKALTDAAEAEAKRLRAEVDAKLDIASKSADMTTGEAQKEVDRLTKLKGQQEDAKKIIYDAIEEEVKSKMPSIALRLGAGLRDAIEQGIPAIKERPEFKGLYDELDKIASSSTKSSAEIDIYNQKLKEGGFAANDSAAGIKESNKESVERLQRESDLKKQEYADSQMTSEAAKKRLDLLKEEHQRTTDDMAKLEPFLNVSEEAGKKYAELFIKQQAESQEINDLTGNIIPLIQAREAEADAIKQTKKDLDDAAKAIADFGKGKADAETALANQIETGRLRETQAEAKARQDTADRIADIRTNLGEKEQSLATNYQRSIFDDRVKFYNDWAKLDLKASEDSQDNQIEHIQKLRDIQNRASIDDQQALLDRNFLQLAKNQLGRSTQTQQEETHYNESQQALARHLQFQQLQLANNLRIQEEQDQRAYQRKLADAETLAANDIAHQRVLEDRKLQAIRQGLDNEIALYRLAENQKIAIMTAAMNQIVSAAMADLAKMAQQGIQNTLNQSPIGRFVGGIGHSLGLFAEGGTFGADQPFIMSEPGAGPETLRIGGQGYNVGGAAMVYPMQGGQVEKGGSSSSHSTYAPTNNFYESHDMGATQRMVEQVQQRQLKEFFGA